MGLCPGGSTCCPLGTLCTADGYCMQPGRVYCGGGRSCQAGRICTNCADGLRCTTDGRCRAAAVDPNCTQWSRQLDGSYFRVCVDNRGMRYCERAGQQRRLARRVPIAPVVRRKEIALAQGLGIARA